MRQTRASGRPASRSKAMASCCAASSGAGKSDLALRLIGAGAHLVADDYTCVRRDGERLLASAPERIAGLLEVRGVGILSFPALRNVRVAMVIDLVASDAVPRLPAAETRMIAGVPLPLLRIAPFENAAALKVRLAVRLATGGIIGK